MANLVGGMLFGTIGFFAFMVGKRQANYKTLGIGLALMAYPYLVSNTAVLYLVGVGLIVALVLFRDG